MKNYLHKCLFSLRIADLFGMLRPVSAVIVRKGHQYLIVQKPRKEHAWQFPQGGQDAGETKIEAAARELHEECGSKLKVDIQPKPIGTYRYMFPADFVRKDVLEAEKKSLTDKEPDASGSEISNTKKAQRSARRHIGAKVTFFLADYNDGEPELEPKELIAHGWVPEDNLIDYFDETYYRVIEKILQKNR